MLTMTSYGMLNDVFMLFQQNIHNKIFCDLHRSPSKGYPEDINKVIHNVARFEDDIIRCEDASDLRQIIHENMDEKSCLNYYVQCMYDFYTDTLMRIQICGGRYDYEYYIRFPKKQEDKNHEN